MVTPRRREGRQDRWVSRVTDTRRSPYARVHAVSVGAVELLEGFWEERTRANRETALGGLDQRLTEHGVVSNFESGEHQGYWFTDSDLYKWIEAAAWSLAGHPDADLDARLRAVTATVMSAQRADGYLNTAIGPEEQFRRLEWSHELYCAGHLVQAALARSRVSDHDALLDGARRFADLIAAQLGPEDTPVTDAHPGIETALVELYRETREPRYLDAAIALAARVELGGDAVGITGHAVRAGYFAAGLADIALETGDAETIATLDALWISMIEEKAYITGAIGGRWIGESVGRPFELPNEGAYAETCGAVAVVHWAWRMLARTGEARYADQIEVALHNAVLGGVSLAGDEWFYANPLSASDVPETDPWEVNTFAQDMAGPFPPARLLLRPERRGSLGASVRRVTGACRGSRRRTAHRVSLGGAGRAARRSGARRRSRRRAFALSPGAVLVVTHGRRRERRALERAAGAGRVPRDSHPMVAGRCRGDRPRRPADPGRVQPSCRREPRQCDAAKRPSRVLPRESRQSRRRSAGRRRRRVPGRRDLGAAPSEPPRRRGRASRTGPSADDRLGFAVPTSGRLGRAGARRDAHRDPVL